MCRRKTDKRKNRAGKTTLIKRYVTRTMTFFMMILVMFSLAGCGEQEKKQPSDRTKTENNASKETDQIIIALENKHSRYNAYCICEENENAIQQMDLEGNPVETFEVTKGQKGSALQKIAYVTNEEIMYLLGTEDQLELWTIPLKQKDSRDEVQTDKKKMIFRTQNMIDILYADSDYIAYKENINYKEFDRVQQKKIVINTDNKEASYCQPDNFHIQAAQSENEDASGTILLAENMGEDRYPENIYVHKVGSGKVYLVANTYTTKDHTVSIVFSEDKIYYTGLINNWKNEKQSWDIWCYDCAANRNYCMVSEQQIKDTVSFSRIDALFINNHEIWMETANETSSFIYCPLVSENESADSQIKKADKLNQYLASLQDKGKDISVLNIENDQCVIEEINAENSKYYCYDIAKEKGTK